MSAATQFDYGQSFNVSAPIIPETRNQQVAEYHFSVERHTPEEIRQMHPDWETREPIPFDDIFDCLALPPDEAEAYMQVISESREESRRCAIEQAEGERRGQ